jgi:8-oxo-dGTP pyrophosphatase MutT (NUDIX family)
MSEMPRTDTSAATLEPSGPDDDELDVRVRHGVKALVTSSNRVCLVKERHADGPVYWTLPGGGVRHGESRLDGLRRELAEELRCRVVTGERLGSFVYRHTCLRNTVSVYDVYDCALVSEPTTSDREGVLDLQWVSPADPPGRTLPHVRYVLEQARLWD